MIIGMRRITAPDLAAGSAAVREKPMKIAILTRSPRCYSSRRLKEAAVARGHKVKMLDVLDLAISLEEEQPDLYYRGKRLEHFDGVIPRIGASITYYGTAAVRQFEQMDVATVNSALGIANSRDKLRALQILSKHDVGIPPTEFVRSKSDVLPAIERVGGVPVIIKLLEGTQGIGVILADSIKIAEAIIETLQSAKQNVLIQKFVAESKGRDVRAFVVGDRVIAAMRRVAQGQEFRSNVHRGGKTEAIELGDQYEETAVRAAQIMGLRVAGVDMLEGQDGPQIMEVNSSPGLEGIEGATKLDIAGAIVDYLADRVVFPEMDLRQRLTVSQGYGAAELPIPDTSLLLGKTIAESGLRDRDILVLTLQRHGNVISNPGNTRVIQAHDRLLCFGRLESMKEFIPERKRRRPKKLKALPQPAQPELSA
jgi:ribosomal protein S6--L-glutamate ligase